MKNRINKICRVALLAVCAYSSVAFSAEPRTGSVAATVELLPATEILSAPMGTVGDPVESVDLIQALGSGAWANSAAGPSLYSKGIYYYLNIYPVGSTPSTARISNVSYTWGLTYKPAGLIVYLCHDTTSYCTNVTSSGTGTTSVFSGRYANRKMIFAFGVAGSGAVLPVAYGKMDQVIVNYTY